MHLDTGEHIRDLVARGEVSAFRECPEDGGQCIFGVPLFTHFRESDPRFVVVDWVSDTEDFPYPGEERIEIARILVHVRPDTTARETFLRPAEVVLEVHGLAVPHESGGDGAPHNPAIPFSPATSIEGGRIEIARVSPRFVRGDVNSDSDVSLSDAVSTLGYLFASAAPPRCLDAADANDDGELNLTDPVFLLGALFGGAGALPAPEGECGVDPSLDDLSCDDSVCE